MAKTGKRILAVALLILTVLVVGCLLYTGNRLSDYPNDLSAYKSEIFEAKDDTMAAFTASGAWYKAENNEVILLEITDYTDGVITMQKNDTVYRFVVIDENTLYDETTKSLLIRRTDYADFT